MDARLRDELKGLGVDKYSYRALPLLPLIEVAWADGEVQPAERELILKLAVEKYDLQEEGRRLLTNWLQFRPSSDYLRRGRMALIGMVGASSKMGSLDDVLGFCMDVAKAAGGVFGIGAVDSDEKAAIGEIASVLSIRPGATLQDVFEELYKREHISDEEDTIALSDAEAEALRAQMTGGDVSTPPSTLETTLHHIEHGKKYPINEEGIGVGRGGTNAIKILDDGGISRNHCKVFLRQGRYYVTDQESVNGTYVNGERVLERRLFAGDCIAVGSTILRFEVGLRLAE